MLYEDHALIKQNNQFEGSVSEQNKVKFRAKHHDHNFMCAQLTLIPNNRETMPQED